MDDNSQMIEVADQATDSQRAKRKCLFLLFQIVLCGGFLQGVLPEDYVIPVWLIEIGMTLSSTIVVMMWCYIDARERDFTISFRLSLLLFLVFIIGFPYYILKTRNNRQALKTLGLASLIFVLFLAIEEIAYKLGFAVYIRHVA